MAGLTQICINGDYSTVPSKLSDYDDVETTNPADGDKLKYDAQSGKWKNVPDNT